MRARAAAIFLVVKRHPERTLCLVAVIALAAAAACSSSKPRDINYGTDAGSGFEAPPEPDVRGAGGDAAGGSDGGAGGAGGFDVSACTACERSAVDNCDPSLLQVAGQTAWGCEGFTGTARTNCEALLACVRGQTRGTCLEGSDPTPCLCGALAAATCVTGTPPATATCAAEYAAAASAGGSGTVFTQFNDPSTPVGIANNLVTCDVEGACTNACGVVR